MLSTDSVQLEPKPGSSCQIQDLGEMADLIGAYGWDHTTLGPVEDRPSVRWECCVRCEPHALATMEAKHGSTRQPRNPAIGKVRGIWLLR